MDNENVNQENAAPETKPAGATQGRPEPSTNKFAIARMASKQRKKRAHRRTLRRSNTKG
jgi:hypothetical protein